jgi:hypothetical protein
MELTGNVCGGAVHPVAAVAGVTKSIEATIAEAHIVARITLVGISVRTAFTAIIPLGQTSASYV